MRVALTGGAGYIGCKLSEQLLNHDYEVVCIDWLKHGIQPVLHLIDRKNFHLHKVDICDPIVDKLIDQVEAVIHLAGIVGFPACDKEPELAHRVNIEGTKRIIDASKNKPFIYASTGSVFGKLNKACNEECEAIPTSTYGVHKLTGEKYLKGKDAVILRPATAFGVSSVLRIDLLVNYLTFKAVTEGKIILFEKHFKRTFLSVNDLARSFRWALEKYDVMKGQIWNVGDIRLNCTKLDIANIIKNKVDCELIINDEVSHDKDSRDYFVDYSKIKNIGFEATETLEDGIENLIKVYEAK